MNGNNIKFYATLSLVSPLLEVTKQNAFIQSANLTIAVAIFTCSLRSRHVFC